RVGRDLGPVGSVRRRHARHVGAVGVRTGTVVDPRVVVDAVEVGAVVGRIPDNAGVRGVGDYVVTVSGVGAGRGGRGGAGASVVVVDIVRQVVGGHAARVVQDHHDVRVDRSGRRPGRIGGDQARRRRLRRQRGERRGRRKGGLEEASLEKSHGVHVFSWALVHYGLHEAHGIAWTGDAYGDAVEDGCPGLNVAAAQGLDLVAA